MRLFDRTSDCSPTDNEDWDQSKEVSRQRSKNKSNACLQKRFDKEFKEACSEMGLRQYSKISIRGMNSLLRKLGFLISSYMDYLLAEELFHILSPPNDADNKEGLTKLTQSDIGETDAEIFLFNLKCFLYKIMGCTLFKE